ncbi:hypothetical protein LWC34_02970 [Kibdelosporangium philippinense]|uniref:Uncharacterized protein n=1 Tax=Kibdelosporangium philippinense TaxID=211113 RepID=A0ABS8Z380_9PSEU|nr:hypothetical protein [Kibdelosporangium philippinense]MCE7001807.1 hypothetical protein [Kibdelosporangium philippinense]
MSKATTRVRFTIVDDELRVSVPKELDTLTDFFETEIGTSEAMLGLIEHHVRHERTWQFTGNACHLYLDGQTVTIEHDYAGTRTTVDRADFRILLSDLRAVLTDHR